MAGLYNKLIKPLFFSRRFYVIFIAVILLFILSYFIPFLMVIAQLCLLAFVLFTLADYVALFFRNDPLEVRRATPERFSNGDDNKVSVFIRSSYPFALKAKVIDEVPDQFQWRDFSLNTQLVQGEEKELRYTLRPLSRGEYRFYNINVLIKSPLQLVIRRVVTEAETTVKVYPSFFALRHYTLKMRLGSQMEQGTKKVRKLGQSLEFEQIKEYVAGDDIRNINWNATAKKGGQLMVNNYTDEKSQQVYCVIDKGRVMKMPFDGLTLLDYAINASVLLSHVALLKEDKAGTITFSNTGTNFLQAGKKSVQFNNIMETLYAQQTDFLESDYEKLYTAIRTRISQRSLLLLFTNFESVSGLQRQLPFIMNMARSHLLIVVFFENTELKQLTSNTAEDLESIYIKTIAEKFIYEKKLMVKELQKHGIMSILTSPQQLTVNAINKYLEIKARQAI